MRLRILASVLAIGSFSFALATEADAVVVEVSSCPFVAMTSVRVVADLDCASDGIVVGKDNITINLGGHTLTGDRDPGDIGIDNTNEFDGVTVRNGSVREFDDGIFGFQADEMRIEGVVSAGNLNRGIGIFNSTGAQVIRSDSSGNDTHGIVLDGTSAVVRGTAATRNALAGIYLTGDSHRVISSSSSRNGERGIEIVGDFARVEASTAPGNDEGIKIAGESARVLDSRVDGNAGGTFGGIHITGGSALVRRAEASANGTAGITILGDSGRVVASRAYGNDGRGVHLQGNKPRVVSTRSRGNESYGIEADGDDARVLLSVASNNIGDGIFVAGERATINDNHADGNGYEPGTAPDDVGLGIYVVFATEGPVGSNVARGNDDPDECDPATLC
jgi:hypothetical protein